MDEIFCDDRNKVNNQEIILNQIVCPECQGNILLNIKDYKINLYECKNGHKKENILLSEYKNITKLNSLEIKLKCKECYKNSININEKLYTCSKCQINLCPLCKYKHDHNHNIINYNDKNFICEKHNKRYIKYCKKCKKIYVIIVLMNIIIIIL